jgi:hypothetical protein
MNSGSPSRGFDPRNFESGVVQLLRSQDVKHALMETFHMSGQLSDEVVAEIDHINGKLTVEERWELPSFIDKALKYGKATLPLPQTLNAPSRSMTVVFDGIWFFTMEEPMDRMLHSLAEADELVILNRAAAFIQRRGEAQKELAAGQRTMRDLLELVYSGKLAETMGGKTRHST